MSKGKVLVVTEDAVLHRSVASSLTSRGYEVQFLSTAEEAIGQLGWPFSNTEVAAMVVDVNETPADEISGLIGIQKQKKSFSLIFLRPSSFLSPAQPSPLRAVSWPFPHGFSDSVREASRPVIFLTDRNLFLAQAVQTKLKEGGLICEVIDAPMRLPEFLLGQPKTGPAAAPGLIASLLGQKPQAVKPATTHVAVVQFTEDFASAEHWDLKIRKTAPEAVCYHVTGDDPAHAAARRLRDGEPVFLFREQADLAGAVLEGARSDMDGSDSDSANSKVPVLLVEHDQAALSKLGRTLMGAGYRVELAHDSKEALNLASRKGAFHVAMLGMDFGNSFTYAKDATVELSQQLRAADPDLRMIFLVDVFPLERALREMSRAIEVGADDAFLKPAEPDRLLFSLRRALQRRQIALQAAGAGLAGVIAAPASARSNSVVADRYDLVFQLGEGGMGVVYLASDRRLGRKVALKKMRSDIKLQTEDRQRFIQEAKIISHLSHPYIVGVHEIVEDGDELYLVLDYVDGMPLSQMIDERWRLTLEESRSILGHLCQAIDYAHSQHVLHRDLKPSNIMIDQGGFAKVMDFGLAWEMKATVSMLTQTEIGGTLAYMAPEQHLGRSGNASDVYALGVCLYEMLTGELPFRGPDFLAQKERLAYVPPHRLVRDVPANLEWVLSRVLAPDPKQRIQTAAQLYEDLCAVMAQK